MTEREDTPSAPNVGASIAPDVEQSAQPSTTNQSLSARVVRGGAWVYARRLVVGVLDLGVMVILARQLTPAEFGLVALAQVILRILFVLTSEGGNEFVIFDNAPGREERVHAAFWMGLTFATGSSLLVLALLPLITRFYTEPGLAPLLMVMLLRHPIDALSKVPDALLKKSLDFSKLEMRNTVLQILTSLGSVSMALAGFGAWSLVVPGVVLSPLRALIVLRMTRWRPKWNLHLELWPRIVSYSANVTGGKLVSHLLNEGDTLLIGKVLGSQALGVYNLAWQSANLVVRNVTSSVNVLALPALSAVSSDLRRLRSGVYRMLRVLSISTTPLLIGLFVIADDFIVTVYGPQWKGAVLPLRILIIYALRYAVGAPCGVVFKTVGRPDLNWKLSLGTLPFYLAAIWAGGEKYGIVGVAAGVTFVRTLTGLVGFELTARCLEVRFLDVVKPMAPAFVASCIMGLGVLLVNLALRVVLPAQSAIGLAASVAVGGLLYLWLLRTLYRDLARDLAEVVGPLLGPLRGLALRTLRVTE